MAIKIKSREAGELAREICKETGESMSVAITKALRERLQRLHVIRETRRMTQDVDDILRRIDALPVLDEHSADEILGYDSNGLPT